MVYKRDYFKVEHVFLAYYKSDAQEAGVSLAAWFGFKTQSDI